MVFSLSMPPYAFAASLAELGLRRACFVMENGLRPSHPALRSVASGIEANTRDFDAHEALYFEVGRHGALMAAFIHRSSRGQGAGGVRHWPYDTLGALVSDGLRLARGMGRKNALAGLWWGGGKGIIAEQPGGNPTNVEYRSHLFEDYGRFVTSLRGYYVTAEDVGTQAADMAAVFHTTRYVTCIPPEFGGSGNPSFSTARGVVSAMQAALAARDLGTLSGKRVAVQGLGNVSQAMIAELVQRGVARVVACDISEEQVARARARFADAPVDVRVVAPGDTSIFAEPCDVFAPCALGGVLNPQTIPMLDAKIVCGAANNQLLDDQRDDSLLAEREILYVPDFLANRMGIVNCANEQYGTLPDDPAVTRHFDPAWDGSVYSVTLRVIERARKDSITTTRAANLVADELMQWPHPVWPGRGLQIRNALSAEKWHEAFRR
jgi:glutamate dehydrogenase/leucine dehydrogenase